ncbi:MAG: tetratricopeptide repeat protein, partial [Thermoguttaceae bacterium]|nr:tetratricopeptide repeat protein [Thermoguttaceae bacterium]
ARHRRSEYDLAIADYGEALRIDSENATALYNRALAYFAKADLDARDADRSETYRTARPARSLLDQALADLDKVIRIRKSPDAYYSRGYVRAKLGQAQLAEADFAAARQLRNQASSPGQ